MDHLAGLMALIAIGVCYGLRSVIKTGRRRREARFDLPWFLSDTPQAADDTRARTNFLTTAVCPGRMRRSARNIERDS